MSSVTCAQWQARLEAAEVALEKISLGQSVVSWRYGEKQTTKNPITRKDVVEWRDECQRAVDACNGVIPTSGRAILHVTPRDS